MEWPTRILYVEDDENDRLLMERASKVLGLANGLTCVCNGQDAIRYLIGEGEFCDRETFPFPTLVITDLKMADGDGFDVLDFLRHNPGWSVVPRIVYSASADPDDVTKAFMLGCSAYHTKSCGEGSAYHRLRAILTYWGLSETPSIDVTGRIVLTDSWGKLGERYPQPRGNALMERVQRLERAEGKAGRVQ